MRQFLHLSNAVYIKILQLAQLSHDVHTFLVTSECHCCPMDPCLVTAGNSPARPDDKQVRIYLQTWKQSEESNQPLSILPHWHAREKHFRSNDATTLIFP
jgi:hypothetical protein